MGRERPSFRQENAEPAELRGNLSIRRDQSPLLRQLKDVGRQGNRKPKSFRLIRRLLVVNDQQIGVHFPGQAQDANLALAEISGEVRVRARGG